MIKAPVLIFRTSVAEKIYGDAKSDSYLGNTWQKIGSQVNLVNNPNSLWLYLQGNDCEETEKLFFDSNSQLMRDLKYKALSLCKGNGISDVLKTVNELINVITDQPGKTRREVEKSIGAKLDTFNLKKRLKQGERASILLDEYIENKLMVCRHKALIAGAILAYLIEQNVLPKGQVRIFRSELMHEKESTAAHAWALYRDDTSGHLWICDPRWEEAENVTMNFDKLVEDGEYGYGKITLSDMVLRTDALDIFLPLTKQLQAAAKKLSPFKSTDFIFHHGTPQTPNQHLRIEGEKSMSGKAAYHALRFAFEQQSVQVEQKDHGNPFMAIHPSEIAKLLKFDMDKLCKDYSEKYVSLAKSYIDEHTCEKFAKTFCAKTKEYLKWIQFNVSMNVGTLSTPGIHVLIELKMGDAKDKMANEALLVALSHQGINFHQEDHENPFLVIKADENPKLLDLNYASLFNSFTTHYLELAKSQDKKKFR